jgi:acetyl-CoA acyltransferase 2
MSPYAVRNIRFGVPLGTNPPFEDVLWQGLIDWGCKTPMGNTAENLGKKYGVTRQECDEYAHQSQTRWRKAHEAGYFKAEIEPITIKSKKGEVTFDTDEHPRETTPEMLAKLPSVFQKNGLVTAGNASGVCDGAGAVVVASEEAVQKYNLTPLARIVGWNVVGCEPKIMGIGPVEAIRGLLKKTGVPLEKIDTIEVNEAFAAQTLSVQKEMKLESERLNHHGGGIAMGHPLAASGARITGHLVHEIKRHDLNYAIGSACIGGGMGIAVLLQKV